MEFDRTVHDARRLVLQFWDHTDLCHCGNPAILIHQLLQGLEAHPEPGQNDAGQWEQTQAWINANYWGACTLAAWDLTEHGSSVYGSWLTKDGIRLRDALRLVDPDTALDDDWIDAEYELYPDGRPGEPADGSTYGSWKTAERD